ncbi:MAG: universal stress protein [Candidatus Competibacteraceae bacterium]|jgi:nucleotide-binding universal stress UspA family protein|nr:universal stress protein [Candidatus Competibacteraceae bacterium]NJN46922.1 universal stress protein [Candidatus Competibacteraceae bacterium]
MDYTIRNILYATDLGEHGPLIFSHAFSLAKQFNAKINIVHVVEPMSDYARSLVDIYVSADVQENRRKEVQESALKEMHRRLDVFFKDKLHADAHTVLADMRVVEGLPAQVILDEAKRVSADLIVVGSHGRTALGEMFIGSVAHKVTVKSSIPVLLVPIPRT